MKQGRPSITAVIVACARAVTGVDPVADRLVPRPLGTAARIARRATEGHAVRDRVVRAASLGLFDHVALRTQAIDAVVAREADDGAPQVVVLGAGLDARAWRLAALAGTTVFEVDHPSTQAFKRERLARAGRASLTDVRFVGVDFERDDLDARLAASGHDASARTTWLWEGVTMYLDRGAIEATLDVIARRSAPSSVLAMTYATRELANRFAAARPAVAPAFAILGEPLRGLLDEDEARAIVEARGFAVEDDARSSDLAPRFGARAPFMEIAERLLVARRT